MHATPQARSAPALSSCRWASRSLCVCWLVSCGLAKWRISAPTSDAISAFERSCPMSLDARLLLHSLAARCHWNEWLHRRCRRDANRSPPIRSRSLKLTTTTSRCTNTRTEGWRKGRETRTQLQSIAHNEPIERRNRSPQHIQTQPLLPINRLRPLSLSLSHGGRQQLHRHPKPS